jgi:hypothetical protein
MTTKKQTTTKQEVDVNAMAEMSGEKDTKSAPKYTLPSVKMNGKTGSFYRTVIEDGELKKGEDGKAVLDDMGKEVKGVILKVRKTYFADEAEGQMYSNEIGSGKNEKVSIFHKSENTKGGYTTACVFTGLASQVKERFPELSMIQIIYFLLSDTNEIVRLKVKGMSLGQLFSYWKEFEADDHTFEYETILGAKADKNKFGSFFVNTFKKGNKVENLKDVEIAMKEVYENVNKIEEFYKESLSEKIINGEDIDVEYSPKPKDEEYATKSDDDIDTDSLFVKKTEELSDADKKEMNEAFGTDKG